MNKDKIFKFKVLKLNQTQWKIYIATIDAYKLYTMSKSDIMKISSSGEDYEGVQRELKRDRVNEIKEYLVSKDATFPNAIILNINDKYIKEINDDEITIYDNENTFSIIDGQHRLAGFEDYKNLKFDLNVSIFLNLKENEQRRIFKTINTEHTKINNSQSFYGEINDDYLTPRKFVVEIVKIFSIDATSPWYQKIKLLGIKDELSQDGRISLDTFAKPIVDSIYNDKYYYKLRNILMENGNNLLELEKDDFKGKNSYFWQYYIKQDINSMYKIYFNYYRAISEVLKKDWNNSDSILTKTTGYNAFMLLFNDLVKLGLEKKTLSYEYFFEMLSNIKSMDGTFNSKTFAASGAQSSSQLYQIIKNKVINLFTV